ncbi:MAG TPA: hypothetical protein VFZ65_21325 [Planctomycetota bacterium]|nr:hypothetical protein [Planctomycetota bacterium]
MNHPEPETLLRYADGEPVDASIVEHLHTCTECHTALTELGRFEADVAAATPIRPHQRQAMRAVAQRLLEPPRSALRTWRLTAAAVALAAGVLAMFALWAPGRPVCTIEVHRYEPPGTMRSGHVERFQIDVDVAAPRWLAIWSVDDRGRPTRLLPNVEPTLRYLGTEMPLVSGRHRVPASELLDFEFTDANAPRALLLVPSVNELQPAGLAAIERVLVDEPRERWLAAVAALHAEAQLIPFPAR